MLPQFWNFKKVPQFGNFKKVPQFGNFKKCHNLGILKSATLWDFRIILIKVFKCSAKSLHHASTIK